VHVAPATDSIRALDGRVVAFADQVTGSIERQMTSYFTRLESRMPGVAIERVVRFGDPVKEIVEEAESAGADLIAFAAPIRPGLVRWLGRTIPKQVSRTTTIPLLLLRRKSDAQAA